MILVTLTAVGLSGVSIEALLEAEAGGFKLLIFACLVRPVCFLLRSFLYEHVSALVILDLFFETSVFPTYLFDRCRAFV
jgi:hypothetical protein